MRLRKHLGAEVQSCVSGGRCLHPGCIRGGQNHPGVIALCLTVASAQPEPRNEALLHLRSHEGLIPEGFVIKHLMHSTWKWELVHFEAQVMHIQQLRLIPYLPLNWGKRDVKALPTISKRSAVTCRLLHLAVSSILFIEPLLSPRERNSNLLRDQAVGKALKLGVLS